jgi:hypothetical protein
MRNSSFYLLSGTFECNNLIIESVEMTNNADRGRLFVYESSNSNSHIILKELHLKGYLTEFNDYILSFDTTNNDDWYELNDCIFENIETLINNRPMIKPYSNFILNNCTFSNLRRNIISSDNVELYLLNCKFNHFNFVDGNGVIDVYSTCSLTIFNCSFYDCCGDIRFSSSTGTFSFSDSTIQGYSSTTSSNTILIGSSYIISHCDYSDITQTGADLGAAIHSRIPEGKEFVVKYCTFTRCKQTREGSYGASQAGGILAHGENPYVKGKVVPPAGTLIIIGCNFTSCSSNNDGGSICIRGPDAVIEDCRFINSYGGHWGGAVAITYRYSYNFTRCVFINCSSPNVSAGRGGGVNFWDEVVEVYLDKSLQSLNFYYCYFENNTPEGSDVSLFPSRINDTEFESYLTNCISRTRREGDSPPLIYNGKNGNIFNDLVPYSHVEYLYCGRTYKDVEFCGSNDYPCFTLEYTYYRFDNYFLSIN